MKHYPKIKDSKHCPMEKGIAFEKYDGTNFHWDWDAELGWYAFGTRSDSFTLNPAGIAEFEKAHPKLKGVADLFDRTLSGPMSAMARSLESCVLFTEYFGPNSFAGRHKKVDEKRLVVIDIRLGKEIIGPYEFIEITNNFKEYVARIVFQGKITGKFLDDVRQGKYKVNEGVVCKGGKTGSVWMAKVKTYAYMKRLKEAFAADWERYWEN